MNKLSFEVSPSAIRIPVTLYKEEVDLDITHNEVEEILNNIDELKAEFENISTFEQDYLLHLNDPLNIPKPNPEDYPETEVQKYYELRAS